MMEGQEIAPAMTYITISISPDEWKEPPSSSLSLTMTSPPQKQCSSFALVTIMTKNPISAVPLGIRLGRRVAHE